MAGATTEQVGAVAGRGDRDLAPSARFSET